MKNKFRFSRSDSEYLSGANLDLSVGDKDFSLPLVVCFPVEKERDMSHYRFIGHLFLLLLVLLVVMVLNSGGG